MIRKYKLDKEETKLVNSIEKGEWGHITNVKAHIDKYSEYAKDTLKKDKRICIRMSKQDLMGIQSKAVDEGMPYQTLITSIVHKYIKGSLVPK